MSNRPDDGLRNIPAAAAQLKAWDAVAVLGAGTSVMAGFPLTGQLDALVRHSVERSSTLDKLAEPGHGSPEVLAAAFDEIARDEAARTKFQHGFSRLNSERLSRPSPAHTVLAELVHRGLVTRVISLNWDTRLEAAYRSLYGRLPSVEDDWLDKPHGDAARPEEPWVLPHQPGRVPQDLVDELKELAQERPRVLLVIGYSEKDEVVVDRLIEPLSRRWNVCRIGPGARGDLAIPLQAEEGLPLLLEELALPNEVPGWRYVGFENQRDLGSALAGRRLGPEDAESCPRLPEVGRLKQLIEATNSGLLVGQSGSGKSVSCFQVALDLHNEGWEVLRLLDDEKPDDRAEGALAQLPHPTLALIDNAQRLRPELLRRLLSKASPDLRVVAASSDPLPSFGEGVEIAEQRAVEFLADAFRTRRAEILPIVRSLDSRVGEGYMDESLDRRIDHAESTAKSPWEFSFTVSGGWKRAKDEVVVLRERDRADLLLAAIAARQIALADSGVAQEWLLEVLPTIERSGDWLSSSTDLLLNRRAVLQTRAGRLRCPHGRYAELVLRTAFRLPKDEEWEALTNTVRSALQSGSPPLRGVFRLLFELWFADAFPWASEDVVDDEMLGAMVDRVWRAPQGSERGAAAYLLMALLRWREERILTLVREHVSQLGMWIDEADANEAWGIASLVNEVYNAEPTLAEAIASSFDPKVLIDKLTHAPFQEWPAWEQLSNRLAIAGSWRKELDEPLDHELLIDRAGDVQEQQVVYFSYLARAIAPLNHNLALDLVEIAAPAVATALNNSPAKVFPQLHDLVWFVLGYAPNFLRRRQPSRDMNPDPARGFAEHCLSPHGAGARV